MVNSINEPALRRGIPMTRTISGSGDHMRRNASRTKTRGPAFLMSNVLLTGSGKADVKINSRVVSRRKTTLKTPAFFSNSCSKSSEIMSSASNAELRAAPNQVALICSLAKTEKRTGQRSKLLPTSQKQLSVLETVPTTSYTSLTAPIFDSYEQTVLSKYSERA